MRSIPAGMRFLVASATGRARLPVGGAGLRRALTPLSARRSPGPCCLALCPPAPHRHRRPGRAIASVPSLLAAVVVFGACSGGDTKTVTVRETVTQTSSVPSETPAVLTVYFLRGGKVVPVSRAVVTGPAVGAAAVRELLEGPTSDDGSVRTAIPSGTTLKSLTVRGGVASVALSSQLTNRTALAQLVYTLTQFPTVKRVDFGADAPVGRKAFEPNTPAILVESPLPGETVEPGFEARGTANTFEATFNYELKDADGRVLKKSFVTATSGSGTRGTFEFKVPYEVDQPQDGQLVVFELSAADGSRINESEIPLRLE
jgi:germination protein M